MKENSGELTFEKGQRCKFHISSGSVAGASLRLLWLLLQRSLGKRINPIYKRARGHFVCFNPTAWDSTVCHKKCFCSLKLRAFDHWPIRHTKGNIKCKVLCYFVALIYFRLTSHSHTGHAGWGPVGSHKCKWLIPKSLTQPLQNLSLVLW